jgi:hypothetical protein
MIMKRIKKSLLFAGILALFLMLTFALVSAGRALPTPVLDDEILTAKALTEARAAGLIDASKAKKVIRMDLVEWNALVGIDLGADAAKFGLTPDIPVFILAIKGDIEWRGVGLPRPGQDSPERYDNITVVLDARSGDLIWIGSYYPDQPMPVPIP